MEASTIALIIIGVLMILYFTEIIHIAAASVLACVSMAIFGVIPFGRAFAGFGNDIVFLLAGMMIVGIALFETGAAKLLGTKIVSVVGTNEKVFIAALTLVAFPITMFISNTATAAIMLPLAGSAIAQSKGKFTKKNTFMLVSMAAVAGGSLTLVSSPPQLIAQGILEEGGHQTMGFFDIALLGGPVALFIFTYSLTLGYWLQKKFFKFEEVPDEAPAQDEEKPKSIVKMLIVVGVLVFCIVGFITELWTAGIVAMLGGIVCIATGCVSQKAVFRKMDWTTLVLFGASFGFGAGLQDSGAGAMLAQGTIRLLGDSITPWLLCAVLAVVAVLISNFMSSTATAVLLIPIGVFSAIELGYDVRSVAMAVAAASSLGFATPVSTPPMTMALAGGYRFKDYLIVAGLFNILALVLIILLFPIVLNL